MKKTKQFKSDRRRALRGLATTPALAAAAVATNAHAAPEAVTPQAPKQSKGYHETKHVRDYYRSADI
jgi:hypothetical protein